MLGIIHHTPECALMRSGINWYNTPWDWRVALYIPLPLSHTFTLSLRYRKYILRAYRHLPLLSFHHTLQRNPSLVERSA